MYAGKGKRPAGRGSTHDAGPSRLPQGGVPGGGVCKVRRASRRSKEPMQSSVVETSEEPQQEDPLCDFCPRVNRNGGTLASLMLGPFHRGSKKIHVHHVCAMWAPEVIHDPDTDQLQNVVSAYTRSRGLLCSVCRSNGATVGCHVEHCPNVYHYCCLYGSTLPSRSCSEETGSCARHDDYFSAFCPGHASRALDDVYLEQMRGDAAVSTFLSDRAAAVNAALDGNPEAGMTCPGYGVTGIRRNETETIFCRVWRVVAVPVDRSQVTIVTRSFRRVLRRGEAVFAHQLPRHVPRSALAVALRPMVSYGSGTAAGGVRCGVAGTAASAAEDAGAPRAFSAGPSTAAAGDGDGTPHRRSPVFLLRNVRSAHACEVRRSLPAVPPSFLHTEVVEVSHRARPISHPARNHTKGAAGAPLTSGAEPASVRLFGAMPRPVPVPRQVDDGSETKQ